MPDLLHPRDESGLLRRFRSHREAFLWVVHSLASYGPRLLSGYAYAAMGWLAWSVGRAIFTDAPLDLVPPDIVFLALVAVVFPMALWLVVSVVVYAYLVLSGGVMNRAERRRVGEHSSSGK